MTFLDFARRRYALILVALGLIAACGLGLLLDRWHVLPGDAKTPAAPVVTTARAREALSGDSFRLADGRVVRLIGVDAPFPDQPGFAEAKALVQSIAGGKDVRLENCPARPTDKQGRALAFATVGDILLNRALLERGLAELYPDPMCLGERRGDLWTATREAFDARRGLWADAPHEPINAARAAEHLKRYAVVRGVITAVREGKKVTTLECEGGFRYVLFPDARPRFEAILRAPLTTLVGASLVAWGKIKDFHGPEMVLDDPAQGARWGERARTPE